MDQARPAIARRAGLGVCGTPRDPGGLSMRTSIRVSVANGAAQRAGPDAVAGTSIAVACAMRFEGSRCASIAVRRSAVHAV